MKRRGPFSANQLINWQKKGFFAHEFSCQHANTRAWIPVFLLQSHYEHEKEEAKSSLLLGLGFLGSDQQHDDDMDMMEMDTVLDHLRHDQGFVQVRGRAGQGGKFDVRKILYM